ncbi:MAG: paraquat-inducible protein A [Verrucomicrobiae bacterium]|nr:paraquat-inducible protein A [Verrucomicrobiae bacterium]
MNSLNRGESQNRAGTSFVAPVVLGLLLSVNSVALWLGLTLDAVTIAKTVKKDVLGISFRLLDERATHSILSGILQLRADREWFLFYLLFSFSVVFPILKLLASWGLFISLLGRKSGERAARWAGWLHHLGKWSMLDVFALALLAVLFKLGGVTRLKVETGIYWFAGAVACGIAVAIGIGSHARRIEESRTSTN